MPVRTVCFRWCSTTQRAAALGALLDRVAEPIVTVDLVRCMVSSPDGAVPFTCLRTVACRCSKVYETSLILRMEADIDAFQRVDRDQRPWIYLDRA